MAPSHIDPSSATVAPRARLGAWSRLLLPGVALVMVLAAELALNLLALSNVLRATIDVALVAVAGATIAGWSMWWFARRAQVRYLSQVQQLANLDGLSGLYNFRYLRRMMRSELAAAARDGTTCALIMLDLNDFKDMNERLGQEAGDELLAAIGRELRDEAGDHGIVGRYDGDEFAVLLPGANFAQADAMSVRMLEAVARVSICSSERNRNTVMSASHGIAVYPEDGADDEALIAHADRHLYHEKTRSSAAYASTEEGHAQDVFFAIGEATGKSLDPQQLEWNLVKAVGRSLELDSCSIWLAQANGEMHVRSFFVADAEFARRFAAVQALRQLREDEMRERGMLAEGPRYTDDVASSEVVTEEYRELFAPGVWMLSVPLALPHAGMLLLTASHARSAPASIALVDAVARLATVALRNADRYAHARQQGERLAALAGIGGMLFGEGSFAERLAAIVRKISDVTRYDSVTLDTADPSGGDAIQRHFEGFDKNGGPVGDPLRDLWLSTRPTLSEPAVKEFLATVSDPIVMYDPINEVGELYRPVIVAGDIKMSVVVPVVWRGELKGLFYFASYTERAFDEDDLALMRTLAAQLAPSLQVATLHIDLERSYEDLKDSHRDAILRLAYAAESRDPYTGRYLQRIGALAEEIARRVGMDDDEVEAVGYAAIVHDLGKLRIPDAVLMKPGELNSDDWAVMKKHPEYGADILGNGAFYDLAGEVALHHHERWDGSGYPFGLEGEAIPLAARIVMVADIYDALISARPYKQAWPAQRAIAELRHMRGVKLCPQSVDAFLAMWADGTVARIEEATEDASFESDFRERWAA